MKIYLFVNQGYKDIWQSIFDIFAYIGEEVVIEKHAGACKAREFDNGLFYSLALYSVSNNEWPYFILKIFARTNFREPSFY